MNEDVISMKKYEYTIFAESSLENLKKVCEMVEKDYPIVNKKVYFANGGDSTVVEYSVDDYIIKVIDNCFVDAIWIESTIELNY